MHHPRLRAPLVTPSLQSHNSISPPKYIHFNMHITGRQHGHKGAPPAAVPTWWNGRQATSPGLLAPNRWTPSRGRATRVPLPVCQLRIPRKPPSRSVVARIRFCPHHSYSSKRVLFSCSMSTASSSAMQEPSLCEEQSRIMRVPGRPYLPTGPARKAQPWPPAAVCQMVPQL